ncbi:hypothetical protein BgiMline_036273, partial [Biomphalaria glabrata]
MYAISLAVVTVISFNRRFDGPAILNPNMNSSGQVAADALKVTSLCLNHELE